MGQDASPRPVILAFLFVTVVTNAPYLRAALDPPPGRSFVGFFHYVDDAYNYLSFVQQAEDGAFLFRNKLVPEDHPPALINLEWWLVGRLSRALGRHPLVAYRLFGILAAFAFLAGADRWLRRAGLPDPHRLPALLLVSTGGGLGGILFELTGLPSSRCLDLSTGLFPFMGLLANPHFVAGTALLLWALWSFETARDARPLAGAVLLGSVLALVRPYDFVLLVSVRVVVVILRTAARQWLRQLWPLACLMPVVLYLHWVFSLNPAFAFFSAAPYASPHIRELMWALGPATVLALAAIPLWRAERRTVAASARAHLLTWVALGMAVVALHPVHFSLQFLAGLGAPVLLLGALGLSRLRPAATVIAAVFLGTTAMVALRIALAPDPHWHVPAERMETALAARGTCRAGDLLLAPADIGLYAAGLSACSAYVSHAVAPDHAVRLADVRGFFEAAEPEARRAFLDRHCVTHLALPGDPGPVPRGWLGESTPFRQVARVGRMPGMISLYAREGRTGCAIRPDVAPGRP